MKNKTIVKLTLLLLITLSSLCTGVVNPALPLIQKHFSDVANANLLVKLMVVMPNVFMSIFSPVFGVLAQKVSKIKLLFFAILLYAVAGTSGYYLPTLSSIIVARAGLGIAIAGIMTVVTALIADYFDGPERSSLISMQTVFMSVGSIIYGFVAGVLADIYWRNIFTLYLVAIIYFPLAVIFLFNPQQKTDANSNAIKTGERIVQNNFAIALICCVQLFVFVMFYVVRLQLPYLLYEDKALNVVNLPHFIGGFHFAKVSINAKLVSICFSCEVLFTTLISMKYTRFKHNRDYSVMCAMGLAFMSLSYLLLTHAVNYYMSLFAMCICGAGMGMLMPNSTLWVISITKPQNRSISIGALNAATAIGKFSSPFLALPLLKLMPNNPRMIFEICAFLMMFVAILSMWANDRFKRINRVVYRKAIRAKNSQTNQDSDTNQQGLFSEKTI